MIIILLTCFCKQFSDKVFNKYLELLPKDQIYKNQNFLRLQDRYLHLFGRLLLIEGLKQFELGYDEFNNIEYSKNGKPFLKERCIDFNISHSGNAVICAISNDGRVGVDIENVKSIDYTDFKNVFTKEEWYEIDNSHNSLSMFYKYWTRKESLIKADGRGLTIPLDHIDVRNDIVKYENHNWYLTDLFFYNNYKVCLATNSSKINIKTIIMDSMF